MKLFLNSLKISGPIFLFIWMTILMQRDCHDQQIREAERHINQATKCNQTCNGSVKKYSSYECECK